MRQIAQNGNYTILVLPVFTIYIPVYSGVINIYIPMNFIAIPSDSAGDIAVTPVS